MSENQVPSLQTAGAVSSILLEPCRGPARWRCIACVFWAVSGYEQL